MSDEKFMQRAIDLAYKGTGYVSPNPRVGAVVVQNGKIIGEGWHKRYGEPHAEVNAIKNSKTNTFEDCTMFVNLEPCSHFGKTPPCADLIVEKKFSKVVIGMQDPNPLVAGRGIKRLKDAGIEVQVGVLEAESKWLNRAFIKNIVWGSPYINLKIAQSIDGIIALEDFTSKYITSQKSREYVHFLRSEADAVLVGKNTALHDDPGLTVREVEGRDPKRIVIDRKLELSPDLKLFNDHIKKQTYICCDKRAYKSKRADELRNEGINIIRVETERKKGVVISDLLKKLKEHHIMNILVEGGASIFSSFVNENLVDELNVFIAPKIIGKGIGGFNKINISSLDQAYNFYLHNHKNFGEDILLTYLKDLNLKDKK